jgi:hypothetical protein
VYICFSIFNLNIDKNLRDKSLKYGTYLANEFSKDKISNESDYMISAIFSEFVANDNRFDGILYPSVRAEGKYFNIAIKPEVISTKLELTNVRECPIIKTTEGYQICKSDYGANNLQNKEFFKLIEIVD